MQVNSSVNTWYYAQYQSSSSVKKSAETVDTEGTVDYGKFLKEKMNEIYEKIQNGDTETSYQIGAQSFTEKEWEEFLKRFDTVDTSCVYGTADPLDEDVHYITWYTEEGIFCRKSGQTQGFEWTITFENREQYDKVMEFIGQFPSDWNLRFAAHENFWNDFLNDEIDMEAFMEFINGTNKGVPDYSVTIGDSMYIDKDKIQWAKYMNPLNAGFYRWLI